MECHETATVLSLSSNPLRSRSSALHLSTSTDTSNTSLFSAEEDLFTVDDIEIQQLEDAESSEEIQPSFGPAVGDRGGEEKGRRRGRGGRGEGEGRGRKGGGEGRRGGEGR